MESQFPGFRQSNRTFNPEATSFNPTPVSPPTEEPALHSSERLIEIPGHPSFAVSAAGAPTQPGFASLFALANSKALLERSMFKRESDLSGQDRDEVEPDLTDSPFQTFGDARSLPRGEQLALTPFRVGDAFSLHAYPPTEDAEGISFRRLSSMAALTRLDRSDTSTATYHTAPTYKVKTSLAPSEAHLSRDDIQAFPSIAEDVPTSQQNDPFTDPATFYELGARLGLPMEDSTHASPGPSFSDREPPGLERSKNTEPRPPILKPPGLEHLENSYFPSYLWQSSSPDHKTVSSTFRSGTPPGSTDPSSHRVLSPQASNQASLGLYGKLIGQALDKPLTAKGLAQYLQGHGNPGEIDSPESDNETVVVGRTRQRSDTAETVRPPRNAYAAHSVPLPPAEYVSDASATFPPKAAPSRSSSYQHRQRKSSEYQPADYQQHVRRNSGRRNHRRQTSRIKRMDQGPMPSSADIYPDDASWTPAAVPSYSTAVPSYVSEPDYTTHAVSAESTHWPTPAEVYRAPTPHSAPTPADVTAAYPAVLRLIAELPYPTTTTLAMLGVGQNVDSFSGLDLPCEERPLTPAQHDGSRYGVQCGGLGEGAEWEFPVMSEGAQFRVRPRGHEGWGGWEWAVERGWEVSE